MSFVCVWAGGQEDAQEAYADAVNAIFVLQVDCHRHTQPHAQQEGKVRWEMIEMWPMQVVLGHVPCMQQSCSCSRQLSV